VSLRRSGEGFLVEFWKGMEGDEKDKMGYISSAYGCGHPSGIKGPSTKTNPENGCAGEEVSGCDCLGCCFPRFRGLALNDGHRGIGLTSLMFSVFFKLIDLLLKMEGCPSVPYGIKISTGRMRKPVICSVLRSRWGFLPKSDRFTFYLLPAGANGEKGTRITWKDVARIRSCFSNNYCKAQDITIVTPFDSGMAKNAKLVCVETEYEAEFASVVGTLNHEELDTAEWMGGLGSDPIDALEAVEAIK